MKNVELLNVLYKTSKVGLLTYTKDHRIAFSYDKQWLENGFSISPFSLPLIDKVFIAEQRPFQGLYGVFADSLPDAWGQLLLDRWLRERKIENIGILDRLAYVGKSGMGALHFEPEQQLNEYEELKDFDLIADSCAKILNTEYSENLDAIYGMAGSSGGARPKILTEVDGEPWIIKFASHLDDKNIGSMEYAYSLCAKKCGIDMPETRLFPSNRCDGHFGIKRFDREADTRIHMLSAAALLEVDFRAPCLDYLELMKLTRIITGENAADIENMFRRMCFNVFAHNRDDHAKNFTYCYDEGKDHWYLAPAYDLTYSSTYYGEHTTSINGNGSDPTKKDLLEVGTKSGMRKAACAEIIDEIKEKVHLDLGKYL